MGHGDRARACRYIDDGRSSRKEYELSQRNSYRKLREQAAELKENPISIYWKPVFGLPGGACRITRRGRVSLRFPARLALMQVQYADGACSTSLVGPNTLVGMLDPAIELVAGGIALRFGGAEILVLHRHIEPGTI